jgi:hypothetical protein
MINKFKRNVTWMAAKKNYAFWLAKISILLFLEATCFMELIYDRNDPKSNLHLLHRSKMTAIARQNLT